MAILAIRRALAALALGLAATAAGAGACTTVPLPPEGFAAAVGRNAAAIVQVVVLRGGRDPMEDAEGFEFFRPLQGLPLPAGEAVERTFSSGFFIDPDGLLLASAHAVFDAREIWVVTRDGKRLRAGVAGLDRQRDVALLKVDAQGMPVVHAGAAPPCPGGWVVAVGTPFGFEDTVTAGVVSAYPRYLHGSRVPLIQSDVVLNPGSSGGPLFDASGALVGMSTMIFSSSGIYVGVSFALPVGELMRVADALRRGGMRTGGIGVHTQPLDADLARAFRLDTQRGALVTRVDPEGPAAAAGLRAGDVILGLVRGESLAYTELEGRFAASRPGSTVELQVWRDGQLVRLRTRIGPGSADPLPPLAAHPAAEEVRLGLGLVVVTRAVPGMAPGLYVDSATGSALLAGIERGDRIVAVGSTPVATSSEFDAALAHAGDPVALLVARGASMVYLPVARID
jgi:serine protease Do